MVRFAIALASAVLACQGAGPGKLVPIPANSRQVSDALTGVGLTVSTGPFLIAPAETTQREFQEIMGYNPSFHRAPDLPVENVAWWEAIRYSNLRSVKEGLDPCYDLATGECDLSRNGYRLPTEAEWALAAGAALDPKQSPEQANIGPSNTKDTRLLMKALAERSTKPAGSYPANRFGLYDMWGNVWEWCTDYYNPVENPQRALDPAGPLRGVSRVVRGGSYLSTSSHWARGYRFTMEPDRKNRFTGFRVARSQPTAAAPAPAADARWFEPYNSPPAGFEKATGGLSSPVAGIAGAAQWPQRRAEIEAKWRRLVGSPSIQAPAPAARLAATVEERNYTGRIMYLQVEPDYWEKIFVMMPRERPVRPLPVVIVPFYDIDTPAGLNMGGTSAMPPSVRSLALLAAQRGFIAVAVRWFGQSYAAGYAEAVATLKDRHPEWTGLGKWAWDSQRLVDWLHTLPEVDRNNIGIIGHSLGAKMALYAAAFDERIAAGVFCEGGIGLSFTNYEDFWYLGEVAGAMDEATDHHELLALIAPRPFLLIGGESSDNDRSWHYVNSARQVYELFGKPLNIGYYNHRKGHTPTPEAVRLSMNWLERFLGGPPAVR